MSSSDERTHTVMAIDEAGRQLGTKTMTSTTTEANLGVLRWAEAFGSDRRWAVEDCQRLSRRLEADLLAAGETVNRVPPKLMAHALARRSPLLGARSPPLASQRLRPLATSADRN